LNQNRASLEADIVAHCSESLLGMLFPFPSSSDANQIEGVWILLPPFMGEKREKVNKSDVERYKRQNLIIGSDGQELLRQSRVLVAGVGDWATSLPPIS